MPASILRVGLKFPNNCLLDRWSITWMTSPIRSSSTTAFWRATAGSWSSSKQVSRTSSFSRANRRTELDWGFFGSKKNSDDDKITTILFLLEWMYPLISSYQGNGGWDTLWKTYHKDLCVDAITEYRSSGEVIACLKSLGLKYEEHAVPNAFDITKCFDPNSQTGVRLLNFMTARDQFYQSFTPEIRAGILDLLRNKCSTEKDGKVLFNSTLSCIFVHAWVNAMKNSHIQSSPNPISAMPPDHLYNTFACLLYFSAHIHLI